MKENIKEILSEIERQITEKDNTIGEIQDSINNYTNKIVKLLGIGIVSNSFCNHHINDCQHVKLVKYCTFKEKCIHKRAI